MTARAAFPIARALALGLLAAALLLGGCQKRAAKPKGIGKALVQAPVRDLQLSSDAKVVAYVAEPVKPPEADAPEGVLQGVLNTVPVDGGGPARPLGGGVTTLEDAYRISPNGAFIAYLQGFHFRDQSGSLQLASMAGGDPRGVADGATYYKFSPDSRLLGYVAGGEMHLVDLQSNADRSIAKPAATFEFSHDGARVLVRQPASAGGDLLMVEVAGAGQPRKLGVRVGEYEFSPDGKLVAFTSRVAGPNEPYALFVGPVDGAAERIGADGVSTFLFSPDSQWVSFVDGVDRHKTLGNLELAPASGGPVKKIGEDIVEQRWSPSSQALGFRESHEDKSGRNWNTFKVATVPNGTLRVSETSVINFVWSFDGKRVAYLKGVTKPMYSVNLFLAELAGEAPAKEIDKWVYAYQFSPGDRMLWYRSNCVRGGRECDLMTADLSDLAKPPVKLMQGIANFKPSASGERMLLSFPRTDTESAVDLGWLDLTARTASQGIDVYTLPGAVFLDPAGSRVAYLVGERKREGVYVAELKSAAKLPAASAGVP